MAGTLDHHPGIRILSLDGGDNRCLSQVELLREYMQRLEIDSSPTPPCDHFHSIVAVGTASLIAVLIGVLGLSIDEAAEAFIRICKDVYPTTENITPEVRSQYLETAISKLLRSRGIAEDAKLNGDVHLTSCKVSLGYMSAAGIGRWRSFRNYDSRQFSYNPTIVQAVKVAMAVPGVFAPVFIGSELMQEKLVSAVPAIINPTLEAIKEARDSYLNQKISLILSLGSGKGALASDSYSLNAATQQAETTADDLQRRFGNLLIYFRLSVDRGLEHAIPSNSRGFGLIRTHTVSYLSYTTNESTLDSSLRASQVASNTTIKHLVGQAVEQCGSASAGLPPLSPFFIARDEPISRIVAGIFGDKKAGLRTVVLSGLGGSGKTQLVIHFARENMNRFRHIFFIDGSSRDSIKNGLLSQLGSCDPQFKGRDIPDITSALCTPSPYLTTEWLIILDNVDAPEIKVLEFIPLCDHGAIIITTRRHLIDGLSPGDHIHLGVMSPKESVDALIASAFNSDEELPERHREVALEIVTQLGMLPVAITGCYINKQQCLHEYLDRLRNNRQRILQYHTAQRDQLRYNHGVYAAFDTTMDVLPARALRFLGILSFFHYTDIPRRLFSIAASSDFKYERHNLLERDQEMTESAAVLRNILCPNDEWDESALDELLDVMQSYSIVSLVSLPSTVVLRFHPLFHSWANDRLVTGERGKFKAAAIRLLACGTHNNNYDIWEQLEAHIIGFVDCFEEIHVNDREAFIDVLRIEGRAAWSLRQTEAIYQKIRVTHGGDENVPTSRALLQFARVCGTAGDAQREETLTRQVVTIRRRVCGSTDLETMHATFHLACVLQKHGTPSRLKEAKLLLLEALRVRRTHLGPQHYLICDTLIVLGQAHNSLLEFTLAQPLLEEAVESLTDLLGRRHIKTTTAMRALAYCYLRQGKPKADALYQEIVESRQSAVGERHLTTLYALSSVAETTFHKGRFVEAEAEWRKVYDGVRDLLGPQHSDTLYALHFLALSVYQQQRFEEAEALLREEVEARVATMGSKHELTILAKRCLKHCIKVARGQHSGSGSILSKLGKLFSL
ncbi:hypothetical protein PIIN_01144 [Serendipita indica DSM 11827]|uniref:PNPLA domain-containing protein n=1 Tax=Serendipita indica (strain DSM 11827) TaxID=1109443 RepID=G4T7P3_SERID|nr:hypothetical protein PIIN_01144 [Serendipita indica DSM 11827]